MLWYATHRVRLPRRFELPTPAARRKPVIAGWCGLLPFIEQTVAYNNMSQISNKFALSGHADHWRLSRSALRSQRSRLALQRRRPESPGHLVAALFDLRLGRSSLPQLMRAMPISELPVLTVVQVGEDAGISVRESAAANPVGVVDDQLQGHVRHALGLHENPNATSFRDAASPIVQELPNGAIVPPRNKASAREWHSFDHRRHARRRSCWPKARSRTFVLVRRHCGLAGGDSARNSQLPQH